MSFCAEGRLGAAVRCFLPQGSRRVQTDDGSVRDGPEGYETLARD